MAEDFNYDVFLSHNSKDKAIVRDVAERLRADGLRVWFDEWIIKPGDSIPSKVDEGLEAIARAWCYVCRRMHSALIGQALKVILIVFVIRSIKNVALFRSVLTTHQSKDRWHNFFTLTGIPIKMKKNMRIFLKLAAYPKNTMMRN